MSRPDRCAGWNTQWDTGANTETLEQIMTQAELGRRDAARPDLTDAPAGRNSETLEQDMAQAELGRRDAA